MAEPRYGVYLLSAPQLAAVHARLAQEHGLRAAGRFMPHVTLKGFFRLTPDRRSSRRGSERRCAAARL